MTSFNVAAIQMTSGADVELNWEMAEKLIREAAQALAKIIVLPENFLIFDASSYRRIAQEFDTYSLRIANLSKELKVWIIAGTMPALLRPNGEVVDNNRVRTACCVWNDEGEQVARYDKIHLFDVNVDDAHGQYKESATFEPGDQVVTVPTPFGIIGLSICYDLRFPELFRKFRELNCDLCVVPAAFTYQTGLAHWQVLLRARAIENQLYVIASAQTGQHSPSRRTYGHSQIIDPWGDVLAERSEDAMGVVVAEISAEKLAGVRKKMPVWQHRRLM